MRRRLRRFARPACKTHEPALQNHGDPAAAQWHAICYRLVAMMTYAVRTLVRLSLLSGLAAVAACASNPPPPPAAVVPVQSEPAPQAAAETAPAPAEEAQAQVECQAADECKSRGEPSAGNEWACDGGRCLEQAAAPAKADEPAAATAATTDSADKPAKKKSKGKKK
jgi:hypothetical protein